MALSAPVATLMRSLSHLIPTMLSVGVVARLAFVNAAASCARRGVICPSSSPMRVRLSGDGAAHTAWSHHPAADISRAVEDMATADDLGEDLLVTKTVLQGDEHGLGPRHTPRLLHSAPCVEGLDQDDNDVEDIEAGRRRDGVDGHRPLRGIGPIARAHHEPVTIDRVHVCLI